MHWDAYLEDGKGELLFGRPIRWILFLYGGRVVPFTIHRTALAEGPLVQEVVSGAVTYGHRFLTTSGRAGRAVKVQGFDDYRKRLAENFVVLERSERQDRIARELERRRGASAAASRGRPAAHRRCSRRCPDLVEYPTVMAGTFPTEFLSLPEEVLTTTMIHHQHYLSGRRRARAAEAGVSRRARTRMPDKREAGRPQLERVLTARLRDARFFWDADRKVPLESASSGSRRCCFTRSSAAIAEKASASRRWRAGLRATLLASPDAADAARDRRPACARPTSRPTWCAS